ncbi:MBL fold metallo-hydrolase [Sulfuricurvum sp.]|uniref:MBL fold metallo-hydrolase n=1 Tax=Sulfuricurvum sp. TaxID=2025608 RepID=UPI003BAE370F
MAHRYTSPRLSLLSIFKWQLSKRFRRRKSSEVLPMVIDHHNSLPEGECILWLGHASLWARIGSTTLIIDPIFANIPFYRRQTPLPIPKEVLSADVLLITHAHYDHYDKASVAYLLKQNPEVIIVAPAGFWRYLKGKIDRERCFELEWWESVMVGGLFITFVPAKHWSNRIQFDINKALWGGYIIQNSDHTIYHSGDTAMGDHFKEIGERFDIDEAFLPIGAYRPEEIMRHVHTDPSEAIQACRDLGAKTLIPIHYGTFQLSDEPLDEPLIWFSQLIGQKPHPFDTKILHIGEIYRFNTGKTA